MILLYLAETEIVSTTDNNELYTIFIVLRKGPEEEPCDLVDFRHPYFLAAHLL